MPRNLEVKAEVLSFGPVRATAVLIGARYAGTLKQVDSYFRVKQGRLKLRELNTKEAELVYYRRPNRLGTRLSMYIILPVTRIAPTKTILHRLFPQIVVVKKVRKLFLYKNARIHLDSVRGLGRFIEFEVVLKHGMSQANSLMRFLRMAFGIRKRDTISSSYSDLLLRKLRARRRHA